MLLAYNNSEKVVSEKIQWNIPSEIFHSKWFFHSKYFKIDLQFFDSELFWQTYLALFIVPLFVPW